MILGFVENRLVNEAQKMFKVMPWWNMVSWNSTIIRFFENVHSDDAMNLFKQMQLAGAKLY